MPPPEKLGSGNRVIIFCATGSIRLPATPGAGCRLAGNFGLPGLVYVAMLLNGINVLRTAPPRPESYLPEYGSQICPAGALQRPVPSNVPPCAAHTSPKSPVRIRAVGTAALAVLKPELRKPS